MEVEMPKRHGLGFGNGKIIEYEDGTAGYIPDWDVHSGISSSDR
jgi:hypothetical protein